MTTAKTAGIGHNGQTLSIAELEEKLKQDKSVLVPLAQAYIEAGKPAAVIKLMTRFPGAEQDPNLRVLLAQAYFDSLQNDKAKKVLAAMGDSAGRSGLAQRLLGELALDDNKNDAAHQYLQRAYQLDSYDRQTIALLRGLGDDIPELPGDDGPVFRPMVPEIGTRESLPHALAEIGIAVVACGALFGLYKWRADVSYEAAALVMQARPNSTLGDVESMLRTIETYEQVLKLESGNQFALAGLAEAHALLYHEHGMASHKDKAQHYIDICRSKNIEKAERYMAEGLLLLEEKRFNDVKLLAEDLIKKGATNERLLYLAGAAEKALGNLDLSIAELKKAVDISSKTPLYTITLADANYLQGDERNAQFHWNKAGMMNPGHPVARARDVMAQVAQGKAAADITKTLDRIDKQLAAINAPKDKAAFNLARAEFYLRENNFTAAQAEIDQALAITPADPLLLDAKGRIFMASGAEKQGIDSFSAALQVFPDARKVIYDLVDAYLQDGNFAQAMATLKRLEARDSETNVDYHIKRGDILRLEALAEKKADLFTEALNAYNQAVRINQSAAVAYYSLGLLMQQQKRPQDAAGYYEKAIQLKDQYPEVYVQMAQLFVEMNNLEMADQWFKDAEKMYIMNKRTSVRTLLNFYKVAADVFATKGNAGKKLEKVWRQKYNERKG